MSNAANIIAPLALPLVLAANSQPAMNALDNAMAGVQCTPAKWTAASYTVRNAGKEAIFSAVVSVRATTVQIVWGMQFILKMEVSFVTVTVETVLENEIHLEDGGIICYGCCRDRWTFTLLLEYMMFVTSIHW